MYDVRFVEIGDYNLLLSLIEKLITPIIFTAPDTHLLLFSLTIQERCRYDVRCTDNEQT
jgi:hypothetical protein